MFVGMFVGDEPAAPLVLGKVIGRRRLDQRVGQHLLERSAGNIPGSERACERVWIVAAHRLDPRGFKRHAVDGPPGGRLLVARTDPFFAKRFLAAGKEAQIVAHAVSKLRDKARQPTVVIAVPVTQNEPVEPLGLDAEQGKVAHEHLGRVAEIEQVLAGPAALLDLRCNDRPHSPARVEFRLLRIRPTCSIATSGCVAFGMNWSNTESTTTRTDSDCTTGAVKGSADGI